jgi:MarR family protease production transcriptional regulator HPr
MMFVTGISINLYSVERIVVNAIIEYTNKGVREMEIAYKKQLTLILRALYFSLQERCAALTKTYKISTAQQHVLFILSNNKPINITQISKIGCWHVSTVSRLLKPLIQQQYVKMYHVQSNQKIKFVEITERGQRLLEEILTILVNTEDFPFDLSSYSKEEMNQFLSLGLDILQKQKGSEFSHWVKESEVVIPS